MVNSRMTTHLTTVAGLIAAVATALSDPNVFRHPITIIQAVAIAVLGYLAKGV